MSVRWKTDSSGASDPRIVVRNDLLFTAGAIAIMAGLLFPLSPRILDVLLIFCISLTVALLIITFSAQRILEVSGFPLLILMASMLRMTLSVAFAKLILSQGHAGTIVGLVAGIITRNDEMLRILFFGTLVVVIFGTICKAVGDISRTASKFSTDIAPIRQASIDNGLRAGVINEGEAVGQRENIIRETGLFVAMNGAARFILCTAVIELVTIIVNIVGGLAVGVMSETTVGIQARTYTGSAVGAGLIIQLCALITVTASKYLVQKSLMPSAGFDGVAEQEAIKRIKVVAKVPERKKVRLGVSTEVIYPKTAELQDYESLDCAVPAEFLDAEFTEITNSPLISGIEGDESAVTESVGSFDNDRHLQTDTNGILGDSEELISWQVCGEDDEYDAMAEWIASRCTGCAKTILMAAENFEWLPVTVPVNIAMRLAEEGQACLLIDLDFERGAISKVFDMEDGDLPTENGLLTGYGGRVQAKPIATCVSNLWVWPVSNFGKGDAVSVKQVITNLKGQYGHLIVYAPRLSVDIEQAAGCAEMAMLFGPEGGLESSSLNDLHQLLISQGCEILKPAELFARAV